jgi:hypothetical protein
VHWLLRRISQKKPFLFSSTCSINTPSKTESTKDFESTKNLLSISRLTQTQTANLEETRTIAEEETHPVTKLTSQSPFTI